MRAIERLDNRLKMKQVVLKTKALCKWREVVKESSLTYFDSDNNSINMQELLSQFRELHA